MLNVECSPSFPPFAFSLQPSAFSLQPLAFSLGYLVRIFAGFAAKAPNETR
jgi:hypothetical protein